MKINDFLKKRILLLLTLFITTATFAQATKESKQQQKAEEIQNLIQSKNYVFTAQTVLPETGRTINLTSTYDMRLSGDTLRSDLPYFGRAYEAPIDPSQGGIHFKSTNFNYTIKDRKKGGWDITIVPKDTRDVRQMFLTVFENGYASLNVLSETRQAISFNGIIQAARKV